MVFVFKIIGILLSCTIEQQAKKWILAYSAPLHSFSCDVLPTSLLHHRATNKKDFGFMEPSFGEKKL
jgi:hypothetical protein